MKVTRYELLKYEADEGKVFDWKEPHYIEDESGEQIREHLFTKTLFIDSEDSIDNYVEIIEEEHADISAGSV